MEVMKTNTLLNNIPIILSFGIRAKKKLAAK